MDHDNFNPFDGLSPWDDEGRQFSRPHLSDEVWIEEWVSTFTPTLWQTASGDRILIEHMGTDHMINSAAFIWRKGMILRTRSPKSPALPALRSKLKEFLRAIERRTHTNHKL